MQSNDPQRKHLQRGQLNRDHTLFREGGPRGAILVQQAINKVEPGRVTEDKHFGTKAFAAYKKLMDKPGTRRALLDAIADERIIWRTGKRNEKGEIARANRFRFR